MGAELIYKTSSEEVWNIWQSFQEESDAIRVKRDAYIERMTEEFGFAPKSAARYQTTFQEGELTENRMLITQGRSVIAIYCGAYEQPPAGSGWRLDAKEKYWYPKLREAAGKARQRELRALKGIGTGDVAKELGVPELIFAGMYMYYPGFSADYDTKTVYLTWGSYECKKDMDKALESHPEFQWESVKRSEWYAYVEAKEAAKKDG